MRAPQGFARRPLTTLRRRFDSTRRRSLSGARFTNLKSPVPDIILVLAVFAALLVLVALSQPVAERLRLAPVVLLAAIGAAIGAVSTLLTHEQLSQQTGEIVRLFADLPIGSEVFIYVFLPLLIFEAALTTDVRRVLDDAAPILLLAVIATLVAAAIVGLALWPLAGQPLVVCLLLGAVVSTTDPAAVIAHFPRRRRAGAPDASGRGRVTAQRRIGDPGLHGAARHHRQRTRAASRRRGDRVLRLVLRRARRSVSLQGALTLTLTGWTRDNPLAEATLTLALAYLSYIIADRLLHVSGVVATLAAGMTVSAFGRTRIDPRNWSYLAGVWSQVAFWAHSLVFLLASILVPRLLVDLKIHDFS